MTTLAVVTLADGDCDLFPFWLEHYRAIGVDRFVISVDGFNSTATDEDVERLKALAPDAHWHFWWTRGAQGAERDAEERSGIMDAVGAGPDPDWILYTDLDEHHEYQGGLHAALAKADAAGEKFVMGVFCDRLAADGSFPPLPDTVDKDVVRHSGAIDATYPARANLSRDLIGIRYCKVMAAKPGVFVRPGRHGTKEHAFAARRPGALADGHLVHHFKWRKGIIERIRDRMAKLPAEYDWYRNRYGPFLDVVEKNGGKVPLEYLK